MEILMEILLCGIMIYLLLQKAKMLIMTFLLLKKFISKEKNRYSDLLLLLKIVNPYHLSALSTYYYKNIDLLYKSIVIK